MLRHLLASLILSIFISYIFIQCYKQKAVKTIIKEITVVKEVPAEPMEWLSAKARNQWLMDQLSRTDVSSGDLTDDDNIFLNQYYVAQIAAGFDDELRDNMNAFKNDVEDGLLHSIDTVTGNREAVLSFSDMPDDKIEAATIAIQKGYAAEYGNINYKYVEVVWTDANSDGQMQKPSNPGISADENAKTDSPKCATVKQKRK